MRRSLGCALVILRILSAAGPTLAHPGAAGGDVPRGLLQFRMFGGVDGLRNLVINSIAQDGAGMLWVATDDGVYRFDGERFTQFSVAEGLTSSLAFVVGVGPAGEACVGSTNGLVCWDGARFSQAGARGLPALPVHAIASFDGKLWVGTDGGGLYVRDVLGRFAPAPGWTGTRRVRALWADRDGLVVGDDAAVQLSAGDGAWREIGDLADAPGDNGALDRVDGVLRDRQGALWIRTPAHLWLLARGAGRAIDLHDDLPTDFTVADVPSSMVIGPRGDVLLGTDLGIAYREGGRWHLLDRSVGLPRAATRTLFVDREGTIWIGAGGLIQLRGRGLIEQHTAATGLVGEDVWSFRRDPQGTLWVGTNRCLVRAQAGRWECLAGTEGRTVRSFVFPPQGGAFVGGTPSDLLYIAPDGRATSLRDPGEPRDRTILALALGPDGALWIATEFGLDRRPGATPGPVEHIEIPGRRGGGRFASLVVAGAQLWTSDEQGIAMLEGGVWHRFDRTDGFLGSAMRYLVRRADGRLCVAYNEALGVTCFRFEAGRIGHLEHITPADGLVSGEVYFLGEDARRRLWIGTGAGVDVVTAGQIDHFDQSDGLAGDDSTATAFLADLDGSIWLGATGGATHLRAQAYDGPPATPRAVLLDGRLGDRAVVAVHHTLEVAHDQSTLSLEFASNSLFDPKHVEYQARLSPMEPAWVSIPQRASRYPALPPGQYRFEVRARIGAGRWGPSAELGFVVRPAWWQTGWFRALIALGGAIAIGVGSTWTVRAVVRRRTQLLRQQSEASFRAVIDLMPDLIVVYRNRHLIYLNVAARRFLGIGPSDDRVPELPLIERVHPDDRAPAEVLIGQVRELDRGVASDVVELQMRGADGSWRVCEISAIRVELGGADTVVASGRDVTERKRMRTKLLVSDRMASLGTLAAGIAHEINNPLAYVAGNLEVLAEELQAARRAATPPDCNELSAVVGDARDGAERVRKIVQGLRAFSRSRDEEQRTPLVVRDVLEAALRLTGNQIRHRAQLIRELGPVPRVIADDGQLTQVFINLLVNGAQAIPEGHLDDNRITVRARTDEQGRAVIEVEDTGAGMPPEILARVFDPFFTTKSVGEGTGLGLSICHGIVTGIGGQISIDSARGRGTTVRVVLPGCPDDTAPERAAADTAESDATATGHRRHRVMLVDDEPHIAHTMERLLRRDYDITVALCGKDAIEHILRGDRFDAIVTDVMMPNMTGIELTDELQRVAPDQAQRLIFLSGGAFTAHTHERLRELGAPQLEKPVTARELRACVSRVVNEAKPAA